MIHDTFIFPGGHTTIIFRPQKYSLFTPSAFFVLTSLLRLRNTAPPVAEMGGVKEAGKTSGESRPRPTEGGRRDD
jgi:hypothetical protein